MKNATKINLTIIGLLLSAALFALAISEYEVTHSDLSLWMMIMSIANFVFVLCVTVYVNGKTGTYECKNCKNEFKPTLGAYILGAHTTRKRYLKCPKCHKSTWCVWKLDD